MTTTKQSMRRCARQQRWRRCASQVGCAWGGDRQCVMTSQGHAIWHLHLRFRSSLAEMMASNASCLPLQECQAQQWTPLGSSLSTCCPWRRPGSCARACRWANSASAAAFRCATWHGCAPVGQCIRTREHASQVLEHILLHMEAAEGSGRASWCLPLQAISDALSQLPGGSDTAAVRSQASAPSLPPYLITGYTSGRLFGLDLAGDQLRTEGEADPPSQHRTPSSRCGAACCWAL